MLVKKNHYPECAGDPDELPEAVRLQMAHDHYLDQNKKKSIRQVAREHGIRWEILRDRINGAKPKADAAMS
jgi:undecaprenyl pyrophosphate synthase